MMAHDQGSMRTPLGRVRGLGSARSGTEHFWLQRLTAVANIPLIVAGIVLVIAVIGRDHAGAVAIMSHPLAAILMLLMIVSGLVHMRLGMQTIIEDYIHAEGAKVLALMANTFFAIAVGAACIFAVLKISFGG
jgi:succinate dehydrogenase / fumarate reductase membrane anchor subunit